MPHAFLAFVIVLWLHLIAANENRAPLFAVSFSTADALRKKLNERYGRVTQLVSSFRKTHGINGVSLSAACNYKKMEIPDIISQEKIMRQLLLINTDRKRVEDLLLKKAGA